MNENIQISNKSTAKKLKMTKFYKGGSHIDTEYIYIYIYIYVYIYLYIFIYIIYIHIYIYVYVYISVFKMNIV